ncbi:MAG: DUF2812 domain-containing protein [Oscillospiraceae bacterium]|nr:DUF2812 domain-containing protein [Oscillospiraceae bacterium]
MEQKKIMPNRWGIWDWPLLIEHLEKMALEGWLLTDYHEKTLEFVSAEPRRIHYDIMFFPDYNYDFSDIPPKLEQMWEIAEMDGWKHITKNYYVQVFYNEQPDPVSLHSDAVVTLNGFDGLVKKKFVTVWRRAAVAAFVLLVAFCVWLVVSALVFSQTGETNFMQFAVLSMGSVLVPYMVIQLGYHCFRIHSYKKWLNYAYIAAQDDNQLIPPVSYSFAEKAHFAVSVVGGIIMVIQFAAFARIAFWLSFLGI